MFIQISYYYTISDEFKSYIKKQIFAFTSRVLKFPDVQKFQWKEKREFTRV